MTYTPDGGAPVAIRGVFDRATERVELIEGIPQMTYRPTLAVHVADLAAAPADGDSVIAEGVTYRVREVKFDDPGAGALLILQRTSAPPP